MDQVATQVLIPFHPLLERITTALNFPDPIYQFLDASKNDMCVSVKTDCGPVAYTYVGGEDDKVEGSCEKATQKAVRDLMRKYDVFVEDVTSIRTRMFKRCAALYSVKREELARVEKGQPKVPLHEALYDDDLGVAKHVSVDFMSILRAVFRQVTIQCTPVETLEHSPSQFTSWLTITPPKAEFGFECIVGDCCSTLDAVKQSLAKKALTYLIGAYNFEVVDANYNPTASKFDSLLSTLERDNYLTLKERVMGLKEELAPSPLFVEQDCLTPRGLAFQIPSIASPPLPPKKCKAQPAIARPSVVAASGTNIPLYFTSLPELDNVFKRSKFV